MLVLPRRQSHWLTLKDDWGRKILPLNLMQPHCRADLSNTLLRPGRVRSRLKAASSADYNAFGERRKWALVHYIRSLIKQPN